ncbi:glycosyltransferase family 4 protein [Halorubrum sp. 2020YC2]|uniref:glycosyltransferase family 4 protein n=1 Tax=Halorubrum sp. 2020YC2 TaxID=2836432 RepID=UPI001BE81345|nr:glycosyltransferase family 4 protein [Halorubrum sp. 2020YC2]QWC20228.1 glycosyltransferase family 4 protein [Halorubrum sp. 2020YC2]
MSAVETGGEEAASESTASVPSSTEVLVVGPAGYRTEGTGGIGRYIAEQRRYLEDRVSLEVVDTAVRTPERPVQYLRTAAVVLLTWLGFLARRRPDVVHVHTSHSFSFYISAPYVLVAGLLWNRPVILHVHGSSFDAFIEEASAPAARFQRAVFDACTAVVALSDHWRDVLSARVPPERIVVVPNAVDPDEYDPDPAANPPHLVFVSNHIERKGIVEVTEAIDELQEAGVRFRATIAGSGPLSGHAEALADAHDDVDYVGFVSEERKRELLGEGSVYVLPTRAEGLPIAVLEAMAGGNAVVSTDVGGIPSIVDEANGALVAPGDVRGLTDTLGELLSDPDRTEQMGRVSRRRIEESYAWPDVVDELLGLYARALNDRVDGDDGAGAGVGTGADGDAGADDAPDPAVGAET